MTRMLLLLLLLLRFPPTTTRRSRCGRTARAAEPCALWRRLEGRLDGTGRAVDLGDKRPLKGPTPRNSILSRSIGFRYRACVRANESGGNAATERQVGSGGPHSHTTVSSAVPSRQIMHAWPAADRQASLTPTKQYPPPPTMYYSLVRSLVGSLVIPSFLPSVLTK